MLRKILISLIVMLCLPVMSNVTAQTQSGVTLSVDPASQQVNLGTPASVSIDIAGLDANTALGAFGVDVTFNPGILSFSSVTFGNQLNLGNSGSIQTINNLGSGVEEFIEVSLASDLSSQLKAFSLVTLNFATIGVGTSVVDLSFPAFGGLSDQGGFALAATLNDGSIEVVGTGPGPGAVPEPCTMLLLGSGLAGLAAYRRFKKL